MVYIRASHRCTEKVWVRASTYKKHIWMIKRIDSKDNNRKHGVRKLLGADGWYWNRRLSEQFRSRAQSSPGVPSQWLGSLVHTHPGGSKGDMALVSGESNSPLATSGPLQYSTAKTLVRESLSQTLLLSVRSCMSGQHDPKLFMVNRRSPGRSRGTLPVA